MVPASVRVQVMATTLFRIRELRQLSEKEESASQVVYLNRLYRTSGDVYEEAESEDSQEGSGIQNW